MAFLCGCVPSSYTGEMPSISIDLAVQYYICHSYFETHTGFMNSCQLVKGGCEDMSGVEW